MNWPHNSHNNTRESPRYSFTIFTIILSFFFNVKKNFKSPITPLIFTYKTTITLQKKRKDPIFFKKQTSYIYFLQFLLPCFFSPFFSFFFFLLFFSLTLYFWNSKLHSRFLILAFWYLLSILYLYIF